jgi:polysaccharide biosynthesis protein PslH
VPPDSPPSQGQGSGNEQVDILFLSAWYPDPPSNGSKLRVLGLLRGLAKLHRVTLITFAAPADETTSPELRHICEDVLLVPRREYRSTSVRAMLGLLSPTPRAIVDTHASLMGESIQRAVGAKTFDVVVASQLAMAAYRPYFSTVPAIFEELELGAYEAKRQAARTRLHQMRHGLPLLKLRHYLRRLLPQYGACTVVSEEERALVQRFVPSYSAEVIPNALDLSEYQTATNDPRPNTLIFAGSLGYSPNYQAMVWFLREVFPHVKHRIPQVNLTITGDHRNLPLPSTENVTLTGVVEDVRPLIATSEASLAPIWMGGGTRLKILEAMALRTPVIATSKGAEGLDVQHEQHLLIADTPGEFAEAVVRVLTNANLREQLVEAAYQRLCTGYNWEVVMPRFMRLVERVAQVGPPA